jgi:hypothetical protein
MVVGVDVKIQKMNGGRCISKKYKKWMVVGVSVKNILKWWW